MEQGTKRGQESAPHRMEHFADPLVCIVFAVADRTNPGGARSFAIGQIDQRLGCDAVAVAVWRLNIEKKSPDLGSSRWNQPKIAFSSKPTIHSCGLADGTG